MLTEYVNSKDEYKCNGEDNTAKALASTMGWITYDYPCTVGNNQSSNNATGFSAVPAGYFHESCSEFGVYADFWSATQQDNSIAYHRYLSGIGVIMFPNNASKNYGFSVRCLKDN